jgi:hypothetical protein
MAQTHVPDTPRNHAGTQLPSEGKAGKAYYERGEIAGLASTVMRKLGRKSYTEGKRWISTSFFRDAELSPACGRHCDGSWNGIGLANGLLDGLKWVAVKVSSSVYHYTGQDACGLASRPTCLVGVG